MSKQFDQFITTLETKLHLTGTEIAEILWLAQQTCTHVSVDKKPIPQEQPPTNNQPESTPPQILNNTPITPQITPPIEQKPQTQVPIYPKPSNDYPDSGLSIKVPDVSSLPYPRKIAKALHSLIQYITYGKPVLLNEKATVELMAELNGICIPILEPRTELKFDLVFVIDKSDSMIFWQRIIKELQQILKHYGIFRNIQTFGIFQDKGNIYLKQEIGKKIYSPQQLIDSSGHRIIFIVSDCVSEIWRNGTAFNLFKICGKYNIVSIVQMLPERMWLRTALSSGAMVQLESANSTAANSNLSIKEILIWDDINFHKSIKVPVFSLSPDSIETWSKMVIKKGTIGAGGFAFSHITKQATQTESENIPQISLTNEERVYQFRISSSPLARNLASLLASAPVINLPVVRLIQKNFLPQSEKIIHVIAEVFLGGILKPTQEITPDKHPDYIEYRFINEEIRDIFLQDSSRITSLEIINKISEYIAEKLGKNLKEFYALLKNPQELKKLQTEKNIQNLNFKYFATITTKVLKRLGGDYAKLAEEIEQSQYPPEDNQAFFQQFAGNYIWAVKENDIWQEQLEGLLITRYLLIYPQGEVQFGSQLGFVTIKNLTIAGQTLSWNFDSNDSAASITFKENRENSNFSAEHQTDKSFEGWLQYRNENRKDFRGRLETVILPPLEEFIFTNATLLITKKFDFKVATIELKRRSFTIGKPQLNIKRQPQEAEYFPEKLGDHLTLEMVSIPGGTFMMGSPKKEKDSSDRERPQHSVTVPPFLIGKYPITQAQWRFVAQLPQINRELDPNPSRFKGDNRPVERVSWYDAVEFCLRLSQYTGRPYSLPSEAQWEYACRAGTTTPFHFGETITTDLANYHGDYTYGDGVKGIYREQTTEVGYFKVANNFGLYDMHGNVWEWCLDDWHDNYQGSPTDGSAWFNDNNNLNDKTKRASLRGGSWYFNPNYCRSASRVSDVRVERDHILDDFGFRVVCGVGGTL